MKKNILITGGCGFIGSNLASFLVQNNFKIIVIDDLSIGKIKNLKKDRNIKFLRKDIVYINDIKNIPKKIECVIHLAAKAEILISKKKEQRYFKDNVVGLQQVLNFCANKKVNKIIFASSASVYGDTRNKKVNENFVLNPKHFYAYTKYIGEKMLQSYCDINNIKYVILRFFNIYGPKSNAVVAKFISQKLQNKKITIYGNGKQKRDFLHINDLNAAILKSIKKLRKSDIFNLGSSNATSINYLKNIISNEKDSIHLNKRNDDIEISISDINKIKKKLNWYPKVNFTKGVKKMILQDKNRLKFVKLESISEQKNNIKKFNSKT